VSAFSTVRSKRLATVFGRTVSVASIRKAVAVVMTFFSIMICSSVLLSAVIEAPLADILYESVSAVATVGLSRDLTSSLNIFGKIVIIASMYFGRVGPISFAVALGKKNESQNVVSDPIEDISVG
jgi:trk system potassium uptake protein TrkH